jgi:hypothetical protein
VPPSTGTSSITGSSGGSGNGGTDPVTSGVSATSGGSTGATTGVTGSTSGGATGSTGSGGTTSARPVCGNDIVEDGEVCDGALDSGVCSNCTTIDCTPGFGDCNDSYMDGCEESLSDADNCVACGNSCDSGVCYAGGCAMAVFTTLGQWNGNLGGLDGADTKCEAEASSYGKTGTYRAWLHDGIQGPAERFSPSALPYLRPDGQQVAGSFADLSDGMIGVSMSLTLDGAGPIVIPQQICDSGAWSNVNTDTQGGAEDCTDWTNAGNGSGTLGNWNDITTTWTWWCGAECSTLRPLYCMEQPTL